MPVGAFSAGWTIDVSCGETGRRVRRIYACPSVLPFGRWYARSGASLSGGNGNVMGLAGLSRCYRPIIIAKNGRRFWLRIVRLRLVSSVSAFCVFSSLHTTVGLRHISLKLPWKGFGNGLCSRRMLLHDF